VRIDSVFVSEIQQQNKTKMLDVLIKHISFKYFSLSRQIPCTFHLVHRGHRSDSAPLRVLFLWVVSELVDVVVPWTSCPLLSTTGGSAQALQPLDDVGVWDPDFDPKSSSSSSCPRQHQQEQ